MSDVRPFFALRPPVELAPRVASPPYDVIDTAQARKLAEGNRASFLHVSRPEIDLPEGTDEHDDVVYEQGSKNLLAFVEEGILVRDAEPHLYVYAQRMGEHRQVGVVACASVADYLADRIKKHEKTRADKEDDRTRHIETLAAHDEPVFLTYRAVQAIDALVATVVTESPVYDFTSEDGVHHRLWLVDAARSQTLSNLFAREVPTLYVADGHHRSAAAARAHQANRGDGREHDVFLAVIFPHDQMNIMAYNRVIRDRRGRTGPEILAAIGERFDVTPSDVAAPVEPGTFGVYVGGGVWHRARVRPGTFDAQDPIESLDCQICQQQILAPLFDIDDPRRDDSIDFVGGIHGARELERRVDEGRASVALYLYPTSVAQVMAVSDADAIMPPKSTWFEPKLKSGLFVHVF
ncbi:MAG: DUF1015 domain-containing protein [Deltaproteobacteria bacterium]|nr:DUF1015 domain-containing protein [Deltaproteobacteria bacterium]